MCVFVCENESLITINSNEHENVNAFVFQRLY